MSNTDKQIGLSPTEIKDREAFAAHRVVVVDYIMNNGGEFKPPMSLTLDALIDEDLMAKYAADKSARDNDPRAVDLMFTDTMDRLKDLVKDKEKNPITTMLKRESSNLRGSDSMAPLWADRLLKGELTNLDLLPKAAPRELVKTYVEKAVELVDRWPEIVENEELRRESNGAMVLSIMGRNMPEGVGLTAKGKEEVSRKLLALKEMAKEGNNQKFNEVVKKMVDDQPGGGPKRMAEYAVKLLGSGNINDVPNTTVVRETVGNLVLKAVDSIFPKVEN